MPMLTRSGVIQLAACPRCHAEKGTPCQGKRGARESAHRERWVRAEILRGR
jgi:hypothetical protein